MKNSIDKTDRAATGNSLYLGEIYSDVLRDREDRGSLRLVAYLDAAFGSAEPPAHLAGSLEQVLRERAQVQDRSPVRAEKRTWLRTPFVGQRIDSAQRPRLGRFTSLFPFFSRSRRASATAALLLVTLALAGAGYALPALERLFTVHTGTGAIIANQLGKEVDVSRSVGGFTVTVRRVYADPNQIVIGLTVSGPPGRTFNNIMPWGDYYETSQGTMGLSPILTDKEGREFDGGMGGEQGAVENGAAPYLLTYNGVGIKDKQKEIGVRLKIGELTAYERVGDNKYEDVRVEGPFTFDLTIPVEQGRTADVQQTVESGGTSVTLERVVTTATGTRLSLRGAGPNADVRLTVGGETYVLRQPDGMGIPTQWTADSMWEYVSGASLMDKRGEWELTVRPGPTLPDLDPPPTRLEGGPWTFRFILP